MSTKLDDFMGKMLNDMGAVASASLVLLGDKLGLYKALAEHGPLDSVNLAEKTGTTERYVREWLAAQAASGYVEYGEGTNRFSLNDEQKAVFADENNPAYMAGAFYGLSSMFLDEPNTALDPAYQIDLAGMLRDWHARGRGLVIISHDLQLPAVLDARVAALRDGEIIADGPVADILRPERLRDIYQADFEVLDTAAGPRIIVPRLWSDSPPPE